MFIKSTSAYCAVIDETGNFGFNFTAEGTSSHFIITAIIFNKQDVCSLRNKVDIIRSQFFGNGEMKSSSISKNHSRRFAILKEIINCNFKIFCLIVDKKKIYNGSPISSYKKSFIKYLNSILYKELKIIYQELDIYADEHGTDKFMNEFEDYVSKTAPLGFFDEYQFNFVNSKNEPLIQLADFISGTISFGFEKSKKCDEYKGYYNYLKDKIIALKLWPLSYENYLVNIEMIGKSNYDAKIAIYCLRLATNFIKENSGKDTERDKILVLEYLLNQLYTSKPNRFIYSKELILYINKTVGINYTDQTFKTNIIASLRDSNVIISSSSNGYKIPISRNELFSYTNITLGMVMPMLDRLKNCRDRILIATEGALDILDIDEYSKIKKYFDSDYDNL